ncbi:hypothetical protein K2173_025425 [Erythroxylum novogranatense]|uniref:Uncharacterized protein n=1 Tax=Erythroxylum novogranatense TaxID=1862640 RepID=A0AAV8UDW6_9ROSI|nr:hypothetical protein K2173_025425 [Erythroxylum novogranatense]
MEHIRSCIINAAMETKVSPVTRKGNISSGLGKIPKTSHCSLPPQVGQTIKINEITLQTQRGRFVHVAVDIEITVPLCTTVELDGETVLVVYEGLWQICFTCGEDALVQRAPEAAVTGYQTKAVSNSYGPWMMVQRRAPRNPTQRQNHIDNRYKTFAKVGGSRYLPLINGESMENDTVGVREIINQKELTGVTNCWNLADLVTFGQNKDKM